MKRFIWILLYCAIILPIYGMNFRQITTADGLTNSAILSLYSDSNGLLWIGTCDGLNISDGFTVFPARQIPEFASISGNIIENIVETEPGTIWVQTNYGLNKIARGKDKNQFFPQFHGQEKILTAPDHTLFILDENCDLSYYNQTQEKFTKLVNFQLEFHGIYDIRITDSSLFLYTNRGVYEYSLRKSANGYTIGKPRQIMGRQLKMARCDGENTIFVDSEGNVQLGTGMKKNLKTLYNIKEDLSRRGDISDMIIDDNGNLFVAFRTGGLIKIIHDRNNAYHREDLEVDIGIFCLEKSQLQNVVWAGTDCHGVYTFFDDSFTLKFIGFDKFYNRISHPVRALFLDEYNSLWIGTKGDGLLRVKNFNPAAGTPYGEQTLYTKGNSELSDNSVYALASSHRPLLWIAGDSGIDYFSYSDNTIHHIPTDGYPINLVHGIHEANDSTLFISTTGHGVFKAKIRGTAGHPQLTDIKQYTIDGGNMSSNYFFAQAIDDGTHPIFGNRGLGIFTLQNDRLQNLHNLKHTSSDKTVNDVFAVLRDDNTIWAGTGSGLVKVSADGYRLYAGVENGFLNNTIHSMLKDDYGNLWISTNKGLVRFNTTSGESHSYVTSYNITGNEFSDGASFKSGEELLFGGVDGIVTVLRTSPVPPGENYMPPLQVLALIIGGKNEPVTRYITDRHMENGECTLILGPDQNYFSLIFSIPDFTNPDNYILSYTLDGKKWINNGTSRNITFTKLNYGKNTLRVKYQNRETGEESHEYIMNIEVKSPWYLSWWAKIIYFLLFSGIVYAIFRGYYLHQKSKQRNDVYESKMKFFSNISHELFTPLTLIYGTGDRLLADEDTSQQARKHLNLIMSNTKRLNSLIQELVDFRKIESGNHKPTIAPQDLSALAMEICESFAVIAERHEIKFKSEIQGGIIFNTDREAFIRIMTNLLSNAFKYTSAQGIVKFELKTEGNNLKMEVLNTGSGISETDRKKIFNRFTILDNVEKDAKKGLFSRNGLGLAISKSLVEMLGGKIEIESEVDNFALFKVCLPPQAPTPEMERGEAAGEIIIPESEKDNGYMDLIPMHAHGKHNILVVDDNRGILDLLTDTLTEYNILTARTAEEGLEMLKKVNVDLIISEVTLPGSNGMTFTRNVKNNRHTMHIPVIILSARQGVEEKVEGLAAGADVFVGKPFELSYLRAVIYRLLEKQQTMQEYFTTSASAYSYTNGQLQDKESKDFISRIAIYIDANIENEKLNAEAVADYMQIGLRNLYRKFKDLGLPPPNEFIKSHKLAMAAKLLVTTSLTVQEVIYRSGFNNRSHFYREFDKAYGTTPKDYRRQHKKKSDFE